MPHCVKITALNQLRGGSVYKGHWFCLVLPSVLGIYWSTGGGGSQGSHHTGRNPINFTDAFCKACQAQQNLALNLLLLWFYLSSCVKAIFKAGYLVQMHAIKHVYVSHLVDAVGGREHVTKIFSKNIMQWTWSLKDKGLSTQSCIWKLMWVTSLHRQAGSEWSGKGWEVGNAEQGPLKIMRGSDIPKEGYSEEYW